MNKEEIQKDYDFRSKDARDRGADIRQERKRYTGEMDGIRAYIEKHPGTLDRVRKLFADQSGFSDLNSDQQMHVIISNLAGDSEAIRKYLPDYRPFSLKVDTSTNKTVPKPRTPEED